MVPELNGESRVCNSFPRIPKDAGAPAQECGGGFRRWAAGRRRRDRGPDRDGGGFLDERFRRSAEGDADGACRFDHFAPGVDVAEFFDGFFDGDAADLVALVADHVAEEAFVDELHGFDAEADAEDAVEGGGASLTSAIIYLTIELI